MYVCTCMYTCSPTTHFHMPPGVQQLTAYLGLVTSLFLAAFIGRELAVRDAFLILIFIQLFLSGFPFQLPYITDYMDDVSKLNPMRWIFESLMVWKFEGRRKKHKHVPLPTSM